MKRCLSHFTFRNERKFVTANKFEEDIMILLSAFAKCENVFNLPAAVLIYINNHTDANADANGQ